MTEENVIDFPTTAKQEAPVVDTSPEGLKKLVEDGTPEVLKLVNQNRKEGAEQLRRKVDSLEVALDAIRRHCAKNGEALMTWGEGDDIIFSLENELINIQKGLQAVSTYVDAQNSLTDMIINDIVGMVQNMGSVQQAVMVSNSQCQTLIELLMNKGTITEDEMKETWKALVENKRQQMQEEKANPTRSE